jgi:nitrous oxide reductase accessory protein NosL
MKKTLLSILSSTLVLAGCNSGGTTTNPTGNSVNQAPILQKFNKLRHLAI